MPETTPLPSSINNPTLSNDSIFALQLDTKQRFDNVLSGMQKPITYPIPDFKPEIYQDGLTQHDLLNPDYTKGTIGNGLFSPDKNVADAAALKLRELGSSQSLAGKGIGVPEHFGYSKEMDKYIKGDFGYNPYVSLQENENFNYKYDYLDSSFMGRAFRNLGVGTTRFLGSVGLKTAQTFGYLGGMIWNGIEKMFDPSGVNWSAAVADNTLARWAERTEESMKSSNLLSVFKPADWADRGFFSKLTDPNYWTDEIADGAAFMGSMILTDYLTGGAANLVGIGKIGEIGINMSRLAKYGKFMGGVGKAADLTTQFLTGAKDLSGVGRWAMNVSSEAAMEASQGFTDYKNKLKEERSLGLNKLTDGEIEAKAGNVASDRFVMNLAILSLSNAFENRFIFEPIFKGTAAREGSSVISKLTKIKSFDEAVANKAPETALEGSRKTYNYATKLGKTLNWKDPNSRLRFYGVRALESTAMEGFWEENAQLAIERLAPTDSYQNSSAASKLGLFGKQLLKQTGGALTGKDKEAGENIGLGGVIGVLGTGATAKVTNERKNNELYTGAVLAQYNNLRRNFLDLQNFYIRNADGTIQKNEDGTFKVDEEKLKAVADGLQKIMGKQVTASNVENPAMKKVIQMDALSDFIFSTKQSGLFDKVMNHFTKLKGMKASDVESLGFDPATTNDANTMIESAKKFGELYDQVELSKVELPKEKDKKKVAENDDLDKERKVYLFKSLARAYTEQEVANDYEERMNQTTIPSVFTGNAQAFSPEVQRYNSLKLQLMQLEDYANYTSDHTSFYDEHVKNEKERINKELAELDEVLKEPIDGQKLVKDEDGLFMQPKLPIINELSQTNQVKHAELTNAINQHKYVAQKLADPVNGFKNLQAYKKFYESVQNKDVAQTPETKTETVAPAPNPPAPPAPAPVPPIINSGGTKTVMEQFNEKIKKAFVDYSSSEDADVIDDIADFVDDNPSSHGEILNYLMNLLKTDYNKYAMFIGELSGFLPESIGGPIDEYMEKMEEYLKAGVPQREEELEKKLGTKADEAKAQVKEWLDNDLIPDSFKKDATLFPLVFLEDVAKQANEELAGISNRQSTVDNFGDSIVDYAEELFPEYKKSPKSTYQVGFKAGKYEITAVNTDGTYNVKHEDGSEMQNVDDDFIKKQLNLEPESEYEKKKKDIERRRQEELGRLKVISTQETKVSERDMTKDEEIEAMRKLLVPGKSFKVNGVDGKVVAYGNNGGVRVIGSDGNTLNGIYLTPHQLNDVEQLYQLSFILNQNGLNKIKTSNTITKDNSAEIEKERKEINDKYDAELKALEDEFNKKDIVPDDEWKKFVDSGIATKDRIYSIAEKVIKKSDMSPREVAIFQAKTSDVEAAIKDLTQPKETREKKIDRIARDLAMARLGKVNYEPEGDDLDFYNKNRTDIDTLVEKYIKELKGTGNNGRPIENSDAEEVASENHLDKLIDSAKQNGQFRFVMFLPNEIAHDLKNDKSPAKIVNGGIQTRMNTGDQQTQFQRQHNVLKNEAELAKLDNDGNKVYRVRLVQGDEAKHANWVAWKTKGMKMSNGKPYGFPLVIAVITDQNGEPVHWDINGNPVKNKVAGEPVAFAYSVAEYDGTDKGGLNYTRKGFMTKTYEPMTHGYGNTTYPMDVITKSLKAGIKVMGDIDMVTPGQLGTAASINSAAITDKTKGAKMRTIKEMIADGDVDPESSAVVFISGELYDLASNLEGGTQTQNVKKGQAYLNDPKSGLKIPLKGKKIKDLTYNGKSVITPLIEQVLNGLSQDREVEMPEGADEAKFFSLYQFVRSLFYSKDVSIVLSKDGTKILMQDYRPVETSLLDYEVNFNDGLQVIPNVEGEGEESDFNYNDFVHENFQSGAVPVWLNEDTKEFAKLNKRIIFTLEKNYKEMKESLQSKNNGKKVSVILPTVSQETKEEIETKPKLSKEKKAEIMEKSRTMSEDDLNNITFEGC